MPRIRTIKPQFWEDEKISRLTIPARLLFIGCWNWADDEGALIWKAEFLRSRIFTYDDLTLDQLREWQGEFIKENLVFAYNRGEDSFAVILNFNRHQLINRANPSKLPSPTWGNSYYKDAIFRRDSYICHYCGKLCEAHSPQEAQKTGLSIDHIIPRSEGGNDFPGNLITACASCNKSKGAKPYTDFVNSHSPHGKIIDDSLNAHGRNKEGNKEKEKYMALPEYPNIKLTQGEYDKLFAKFDYKGTIDRIENLSLYISSKGYHCKSHYFTILSWDRRDAKDKPKVKRGADGW